MITTFKKFVNENEEAINESGLIRIGNEISNDLTSFLKDIVMVKSKGYVKSERDAALLLLDIIKDKYKI
jgi:hypothetical protein